MSEYLGKTIGEYQLIELIAEDENTTVFKGFQPRTNHYVMVILLKPHLTKDAMNVQHFLQSFQLAAQMHHPNILPVYDSGQADGLVYFITSFIKDGTLRENLSSFQNTNSILELVNQVSAALEYIHAQGYVHGNLKSSNIYIDAQRSPLISGIGGIMLSGAVPDAYVSPEQARGGVVDKRSDVYALGVLVYEVLVGKTPPPGMIVSLRSNIPDLPESIERVVLKSMAQNPDQRFQSVVEFRIALQNAAQLTVPTEALPVAPTPGVYQNVHISQSKRTNWIAIILGGLLVTVLCVGLMFFILPALRGNQGTVVLQPTAEQPLPEQPVEVPPPDQSPGESPGRFPDLPSKLPDFEFPYVCNSIGGAGAIVIVTIMRGNHRRKLP